MTAAEVGGVAGVSSTTSGSGGEPAGPFPAVPVHEEIGPVPEPVEEPGGGLAGRVRRGALWSALGNLLTRFANIAVTAVVARIMSPRDFGVFAVALTVHAIASSLAEGGVSSYLVRADVDENRFGSMVSTISMTFGFVLAVLMAAFAGPLASALGAPDAAGPVRVMAIAVFLVGLFAVPTAQLTRDFRQGRQFAATMVGFVPGNVLLVVLALNGGGAMAFAWSRVVTQILSGAYVFASVSPRFRPGWARHTLRMLLTWGMPLAGANLLNFTLLNADYALIGRLLGPVGLGVYMLAFNISSWSYGLIGATINGVALAGFSRVIGDPERLRSSVCHATRLVAGVAFPISAVTMALSAPLIESIYGAKWLPAAPILVTLSVYGSISLVCLLFANLVVTLGRTHSLLWLQLTWLLVLVPGMIVGLHLRGLTGAAEAHVVAVGLVVLPLYVWLLRRRTGIGVRELVRAVAPVLLGSALAGGAAFLAALPVDGAVPKLLLGLLAGGLVCVVALSPLARDQVGAVDRYPARVRGLVGGADRVLSRVNPWYGRVLAAQSASAVAEEGAA